MNNKDTHFDAIIVGAGMIGTTQALALAQQGLRVCLIERQPLSRTLAPEYDGRASAIAATSAQLLKNLGLGKDFDNHASPINNIRVCDGKANGWISSLFLDFESATNDQPAGYIFENRHLRQALINAIWQEDNITIYANTDITHWQQDDTHVSADLKDRGNDPDAHTITAKIMIACDGKFSRIRQDLGIAIAQGAYSQNAIVCTVQCERDHQGWAVELFLPSGPFAMLPMVDRRMNIVWTEKNELAKHFMKLDERQFLGALIERFGGWLGEIALLGPRFSYPLSYHHATQYSHKRTVFVGDCAHSIHPIAGQGLNLGLRDVAALCDALLSAKQSGLDLTSGFGDYSRMRQADNQLMLGLTDQLNRLFSNNSLPIRAARDLGLAAINHCPPLKNRLMRHAIGSVGTLPNLMQNQVSNNHE